MCLTFCSCFPCGFCREKETDMQTRSESSEPDCKGCNLFSLFRRPQGQDGVNNIATTITDGNPSTSRAGPQNGATTPEKPIVILTFEQNLEKQQFFEASYLLKEREERLFGEITEADGLIHHEEEVKNLAADHRVLEGHIVQTLQQSLSLNMGEVSTEALRSAVKAIDQEEEQDQLWKQRGGTSRAWRPSGLKELHDKTLCDLVKSRMDNPLTPPAHQEQQSSFQTEINSMGRQLKEDLLVVVDAVKPCYPPEMDICNFYARLYHKTFSARLREKANFGLDDKDCTFLLRWVNEYYPGLLQKPELASDINAEALGKLLPEDFLEPLEDQYLSKQENELMTNINNILDEEIQSWNEGKEPKTEDNCYVSHLSYDTIQLIYGRVTSAQKVMDVHKAQRLTRQLNPFMQRYKTLQDKVTKRNKPNSNAIIKANLGCVEQFSEFLSEKGHLFPEDVRENCLRVLTDMKGSAHMYLLSPVHQVLKPQYRMLGTSDWLKKNQFQMLLDGIEREITGLQGSKESCHKELIGQFYQEVTVEYVRRLLKGKVKLKDNERQVKAHENVKDDAECLHHLFVQMGSNEDWLKEILTKIAEVLKPQDLPAIQLDVVSLGSTSPDLSEKHVSALLKLKTKLTKTDRKKVTVTLTEALREVSQREIARHFFSKVKVK